MFYLALGLHVIASIFLILVVLLQTGKGGDMASAFGGGGGGAALGPRSASNVLTRATTISAIIFMMTSVTLVMMYQGDTGSSSGLEDKLSQPAQTQPLDSGTETAPGPAAAEPAEDSAADPAADGDGS